MTTSYQTFDLTKKPTNEAISQVVINSKTSDSKYVALPTKSRTAIPQMSMASLESAAYRTRMATAAQSTSSSAQMPKITHFASKAKPRTSMLQMAAPWKSPHGSATMDATLCTTTR